MIFLDLNPSISLDSTNDIASSSRANLRWAPIFLLIMVHILTIQSLILSFGLVNFSVNPNEERTKSLPLRLITIDFSASCWQGIFASNHLIKADFPTPFLAVANKNLFLSDKNFRVICCSTNIGNSSSELISSPASFPKSIQDKG